MKRILIVEDEPRFASFLEKGLTANGYTTKVVEDGVSAGAVADDEELDLMILDLGLPDVDGIQVLRMVRQRGVAMPVIILTARDDMSDKVSGLDAGASDYMTKPFSLEELLARVERGCGMKTASNRPCWRQGRWPSTCVLAARRSAARSCP